MPAAVVICGLVQNLRHLRNLCSAFVSESSEQSASAFVTAQTVKSSRSMSRVSDIPLSKLVRQQITRPSPIRQIMKMAERQNIVAMGLNPDNVISFGGGWVNHPAPEPLRQAYADTIADASL